MVLRADGGDGRGLGHVVRVIVVADAWCGRGGTAELVVPASAEEAASRLAGHLPVSAADDRSLAELVEGRRWLVLDGYDLDDDVLAGVDPQHVVGIDDHGHHPSPAAAVVIDPNLGASAAPYRGGTDGATVLVGSRYALLRPTPVAPATIRPTV